MNFKEEIINQKMVVTIVDVPKGQLDLEFFNDLRDYFLSLIKNGNLNIVINFESIKYVDSAALGLFVEILNILRNENGSLSFINVDSKIKRILEVTNLLKYFRIYNSEEEMD